jgi:RNA polymerase sigma factor (sigma-70 family)
VWRKRDEVPSDRGQERAWVFGVARNVLRRVHERDQRRSAAIDALAAELRDTRTATPSDDPGTAALALLSPVDREIIEMLAWDQLSPREVAKILELSPNVVRIRAHRARLKLREHLQTSAEGARRTITPPGTSIRP